jgi:hypothetical protein
MAFPFPKNPVDGETVTHITSNGTLLLATYSATKNTWDVTRQAPPPPVTLARPGAQIPLATATGQVMTWDDVAKQWIASSVNLKTTDLLDVDHTTTPSNDYFLLYDGSTNKYRPVPITGNAVLQTNTIGLYAKIQASAGDLDAALSAMYKQLSPTSVLKSGDALVVRVSPNRATLEQYAGTYLYTGTGWVSAASGSGGSSVHYRDHATQVQEAGRRTGELDILTQPLDKQINVFDGTNYKLVFGELEIKQWIAAGSLFQGTLATDADLTGLPAATNANRGFYWTWTGSASHDVTSPLTAKLQVGDWIQSDGHRYIHVPSDLMSKQRWESVGSFKTWVDSSYETGTLVVHNNRFYRATSPVSLGDSSPDTTGSLWQDFTPSLALENLSNVNNNSSAYSQDCVLVWDEANQEWTASRTIGVDAIEFDESGPGSMISGVANNDLNVPPPYQADEWVPSVAAVKQGISAINFEDLSDCSALSAANANDIPSWNATLGIWEPKPLKVRSISAIDDVNIPTLPTDGQVLTWDDLSHEWKAKTATSTLGSLTDVSIGAGLARDNMLKYDGTSWVNWVPNYMTAANAYTKAEVDSKVANLTAGLSHEEAVLGMQAAPPANPQLEDLYIVYGVGTGAWAGHNNELAQWDGTAWKFTTPKANETHLNEATNSLWHWNGTSWVKVGEVGLRMQVISAADYNALAVKDSSTVYLVKS